MLLQIYAYFIMFYVLIYDPLIGYILFNKMVIKLKKGINRRLMLYKQSMLSSWTPIFFSFLVILNGGLKAEKIGFALPEISTEFFPKWLSILIIVIGVTICILLLNNYILSIYNKKFRQKLAKVKISGPVQYLLPETEKEKAYWPFLALSAGITEEIIYRGILLFILTTYFPHLSLFIIVLTSSIIFGFAHIYQGKKGFINSSLIGLLFNIFYLATHSLVLCMLAHTLQDLIGLSVAKNRANALKLNES